MNKKNIEELKLSEKQLEIFQKFQKRERVLRGALNRCKVHPSAIEGIIEKSDLNKVNDEDIEALEESIRSTWGDFIMTRGAK